MSSLYKAFSTSKELESDGIWLDLHTDDDGFRVSFKVKRISRQNQKYKTVLRRITRPYANMIDQGSLDSKLEHRLMVKVFVEAVLLDWKNVKDENGEALEFTKENAIKLLEDLPDLYEILEKESSNMVNFQIEDLDDTAKN